MKDLLATIDLYDDDTPGMADGGRIGFKKKGFVNKGGDAEFQRKLKLSYDKYGQEALDKGAKVLGFKDYASMGGKENQNFRNKIKNEITKYGEVLPRYEADVRGRQTRIPKEQGIQIKLIEATNQNEFFDPKAFAKANNISMATLKNQAERLQTNIYKKRIVEASRAIGKETKDKLDWIPNDSKFSDNALNKLWKSKLIKYERNKIDELFFDAFGRAPTKKNPNPTYNPKKFLAIKKNLNEYRQLRNAINKKYPNINFELDHPLSKSSLNKLFNATTDQLTRVNVLEADLNNGFKDSLSLQYEKAVRGNNLNKKKAVEKIARDLKLNIGKISDDATNFKYGVKEFQKLNIKDEIGKSLQNLSALNKNFQTYAKNNPELFKTAGVSTQQTFTKVDNVKGLIPFMKKLGIKCKLSEGINCMNPQAYEKSLNELSKAAQAGDNAAAAKMANFTKAVRGAGGVIKGALGPAAIAFEVGVAVPFGLFEYAQGKPTDEIVNTLTYGLAGTAREDKLKKLFSDYGVADKADKKFAGYLSTLNRLGEYKDPYNLRPGKRITEEEVLKTLQPFYRVSPQSEQGEFFDEDLLNRSRARSRAAEQQLYDEDMERKKQRTQMFDLSNPFMAAGGGIAKEAGDPSGAMLESMNPDSQGLSGLLKRVKKG